MNLAFQVKVGIDLAKRLDETLKAVAALHRKDVQKFERRAQGGLDPEKLLAEQEALAARGRRVTMQHLVRVLIVYGLEATQSLQPVTILTLMSEDEIVVGRPSEGKRGSRAA